MRIIGIIPARMESSRFPGKPLADILGMPMIGHVFHRCKMSNILDEVYVATCNTEIFNYIESFNDFRIKPFQNHNNGIIAVNRNYGIKKATGEYIAFCDDDDYWEKNKLEIQIRYLQNDEFIGIGSSIKLIDGNSKIIENQERKKL